MVNARVPGQNKEIPVKDINASENSNAKPVIEIHPGLHYQQFTDYFDFILDFKELKEIVTVVFAGLG